MRLFSFKIYEELYLYLKSKAKENYTTMTQYLIQLIAEDKRKNDKN